MFPAESSRHTKAYSCLRLPFAFIVSGRIVLPIADGSNYSPHFHDHQLGISLSISQKDRPLEPVVLSIRRVKARRRSEIVLAGCNGFAGGDTIQHILCAMPDPRVAHLDPDRLRCLEHIVCIHQRESVAIDKLPVAPSGQHPTGNSRPAKGSTRDGDHAPEPKGTPPQFEHRTDVDSQFESELELRR
jgi:hypothetical protein